MDYPSPQISCRNIYKLVAVAASTRTWFVNDEAHHLALFDVVECYDADVAIRVLRTALLNFVQNFLRRSCVEQRQLPHCPVVLLRSRRFAELDAREEPVLDRVLDLTSDLSIGQRRQVGERFKTLLFRESFHEILNKLTRFRIRIFSCGRQIELRHSF